MPEIGIIFLHHDTDPVTLNNLASIINHAPEGTPIVCLSTEKVLNGGGYDLSKTEIGRKYMASGEKLDRWMNADHLIYAWHRIRNEDCRRWLILEWDCYANAPIADFTNYAKDFDLMAPSTRWPNRDTEWSHFNTPESNKRHRYRLPAHMKPFLCGVVPLAGTIISDEALSNVEDAFDDIENEIYGISEIRLATLANFCGYRPVANPMAGPSLTWIPHKYIKLAPLWHPVKHLVL